MSSYRTCTSIMAVLLVLAGCASADQGGTPQEQALPVVEVGRGSIEVFTPSLDQETLQNVAAEPEVPGVQWATMDGPSLVIAAAGDTTEGSYPVTLSGTGCVDSECDIPFNVDVELVVASAEAPTSHPAQEFSEPSPDRVATATIIDESVAELPDEVVVVLGTPEAPGSRAEADTVAATVGAVVSGGMEDIGIYQLRWDDPQSVDDVVAALSVQDGVSGVDRSLVFEAAGSSIARPDGDWADDGQDSLWPYVQLRLPEAWALSETRGSTVKVGIVDVSPVDGEHPDLAGQVTTTVPSSLGKLELDPHSTHVAGLACAKENGDGIVGAAWGCPIISDAIVNSWDYLDRLGDVGSRSVAMVSGLGAARRVIDAGATVVNMSIGIAYPSCGSDSRARALAELFKTGGGEMGGVVASFRRLAESDIGGDVLFIVAAGNSCIPGVSSPFAAASGLDNVISVSAMNSDRTLASFSDWGGEVAASGGVAVPPMTDQTGNTVSGEVGVWSTIPGDGYDTMYGTSQAAPLVAGVAALIREYHPDKTAAEVGRCITQNARAETIVDFQSPIGVSPYPRAAEPAVSQTYPGGTPIVDAVAAVRCLDLMNAPVPSLCEHPAGVLVDGQLPGIAENEGRVFLDTGVSPNIPHERVAYGSLSDQPIAAAVAMTCSRGGTPWPEAVVLYDKNTNYLGHVSLGDLAVGRQSVIYITITDGVVHVSFTGSEGNGDAACCGRVDGTIDLSLVDGTVQTSNLNLVDERPTAERVLQAAIDGDEVTLGEISAKSATTMLTGLVEFVGNKDLTVGNCGPVGSSGSEAVCEIELNGNTLAYMLLWKLGFQQWYLAEIQGGD